MPYLLRFYPTDSLVVLSMRDGAIGMTTRYEPPSSGEHQQTVEEVVATVIRGREEAVIGIVVADSPDPHPGPGRVPLIDALSGAFGEAGVRFAAYWVSGIAAGVPWLSYHGGGAGVVSDPGSSVLAATERAPFASREALSAELDPDPEEDLRRRAELIAARSAEAGGHGDVVAWRRAVREVVGEYVVGTADRVDALTDDDVAALCVALSDPEVRDSCVGFAVGTYGWAAELLWAELARRSPEPYRADAATLLAVSAYLRGDGVFAAEAIDRALAAVPGYRLALLLRRALDRLLPPQVIRELAEAAVDGLLDDEA
ncbi:MAG: DUF4192 domain-containing protein [Saccharothrix sp.]|nr:DUF4192 domain-containing protein [Saccharothrix sp.]